MKPAEAVIAHAYGALDPFTPIHVAGDSSDRDGIGIEVEDLPSDAASSGSTALLKLSGTADDVYIFVSVNLSRPQRAETLPFMHF